MFNRVSHQPPQNHDAIIHSNAMLLMRMLSFKIIENQSSSNNDSEGTLRVAGNKATATTTIEQFNIISGRKPPNEHEHRPRSLSLHMWSALAPSHTPTLLNYTEMEDVLSNAKNHDYTTILKEIMLNPSVIGLTQHSLDKTLKVQALEMARSLVNGVEKCDQNTIEAIVNNPEKNQIAQAALKMVLVTLPAYYIEIISILLNMMKAVSDPSVANEMNAFNVGLSMPALFEIMGVSEKFPDEYTLDDLKLFTDNTSRLSILASCWIEDHIRTQQTLGEVLKIKHEAGDNSDTPHQSQHSNNHVLT